MAGTVVSIADAGSGTHTITLGDDMMPYDGIFDEFLREMLIIYSMDKRGAKTGSLGYTIFKKRAFEETIRREYAAKPYKLDF
jgi:hypothetical protein